MSIGIKMNKTGSAIIPVSESATQSKGFNAYKLFMTACCVLMMVGVGMVVFAGSPDESIATKLLAALPLLACVAMHFVMHRLMGKSCRAGNSVSNNH